MLLVYEFELPKDKDPSAFGDFMRDEYIPAVHKGPTRVGQVQELELLERAVSETGHRFLWLVRWDGLDPEHGGPAIDDEAVHRKLEGFGATMKEHVTWLETAAWRSQ